MYLSDLLRRKEDIVSIAKKFGLLNIRITRNIGGKLNLVIDNDITHSDMPFPTKVILFSDYLSYVLKCEIEIFTGNQMHHVVNIQKSYDEIIKEATQLFKKSPDSVYIQEVDKEFNFTPPDLKKIKQIMGDDMIKTPRSTSSESSSSPPSPRT